MSKLKLNFYLFNALVILLLSFFFIQNFRIDASSDTLVAQNDKDFEFISDINLKSIDLKNKEFLKQFFPSTKKFLNLQNHKLNIKYKNDSLTLSGNGNIKIDKKKN